MAIYSLNHKAIGKQTQDSPYTAAAHIRYITRSKACRVALGRHMPEQAKEAQAWFVAEEDADRKNARMCDKVMIALPRELDAAQRIALVESFAERVTAGRTPWFAAIHDLGKDENNPHCHLVFRDRCVETGKRVLHMSAGNSERRLLKERGIDAMTTERMRVIWEHAANEALERAGEQARIDHRSLAEQGAEHQPTLHEGVRARQMEKRRQRPRSKAREVSNALTARSRSRSVDYQQIDQGRTRSEYNQLLKSRYRRKKVSSARDYVGFQCDKSEDIFISATRNNVSELDR